MLKYFKKYWFFGLLAAAFMISEVAVDMLQPKLMATIVDDGILGLSGDGTPNIPLITSTGIKMILVVLLGGLCGMLSGAAANYCSQNFANDVRKATFNRVMELSFEQTDSFSTGSLITRVTNDVSQLERLVQQLVRGFVRSLMFMVVGTITLLSLDIHFKAVVAIAFPLILFSVAFILWRVNPLFSLLQGKLDNLNTVIQEDIKGIRLIKAFVQEDHEQRRFDRTNQDLVDTQLKVLITMSMLRPAMNIILNLATVAIIKIGAVQVAAGAMQPGNVMAAVTYISQILGGMMMLAMIFQVMSRGMASAKRLNEVLNTEPAIKDGGGSRAGLATAATAAFDSAAAIDGPAIQEQGPTPRIAFKNVSFGYPGFVDRILHNIDLKLMPGESLAIVGATGSGKTTLANLIPRFYDVTGGKVEIDGVDVRDYKLKNLRDKISYATQKTELFSTTIKENITIGKPEATEEEMIHAAKIAQANDFIIEQSDGYDTPVAEGGMSLSGGQKQRVSIARALLKHSDILILDDASSALDLATEANLYKALSEEYGDTTLLIIAQRIATARRADKIAVLDGGTITHIGTHEELLETSSVYRDICDSQMKGDDRNGE